MFVLVLVAPVVILNRIIRHETVGLETILGAICVYVLIAIAFAGIYARRSTTRAHRLLRPADLPNNVDFLYFSFVTITTVGYGDLTAGTSTGRVLVTFEALIGQIFLVTLVARLVSMYGVQPARRARRSRRRTQTLEEELGDLDRVERGALAQVVAGDPEVERVLLRRVLAQATDEHRVDAGAFERGGGAVAAVDEPDARRVAEELDRVGPTSGRSNCTLASWRGRRRPAPARTWRWPRLGRVEDLAALVDQLPLLATCSPPRSPNPASGITLPAIGRSQTSPGIERVGARSRLGGSGRMRPAPLVHCSSSSWMPGCPAPETDW